MKTTYTVIGDATLEVVTDGETAEINVLLPNGNPLALKEQEITLEQPAEIPAEVPVEPVYFASAPPLEPSSPVLTKKRRGLQAVIRGAYTVIFSLLGMLAAGAAALRDNLSQLTDLKLTTILIVVGGAVLAGVAYGLKRWLKPDGLL